MDLGQLEPHTPTEPRTSFSRRKATEPSSTLTEAESGPDELRQRVGLGIGLEIDEFGRVVVADIIPGGGASAAGEKIQVRDVLHAIDGEIVSPPIAKIQPLCLGQEGSVCMLRVSRRNVFFEVLVTRFRLPPANGLENEAEDTALDHARRELSVVLAANEVEAAELKRMVETRDARIRTLELAAVDTDATIVERTRQLAACEYEVMRAKSSRADIETLYVNLQEDHCRATADLNLKISDLDASLQRAEKQEAALAHQLSISQQEVRLVCDKLAHLQTQHHEQEKQLANTRDDLAAMRAARQASVAELGGQISLVEGSAHQMEQIMDGLGQRFGSTCKTTAAAAARADALEAELQETRVERDRWRHKSERASVRENELEGLICELQSCVEDLGRERKTDMTEYQCIISGLEKALEDARRSALERLASRDCTISKALAAHAAAEATWERDAESVATRQEVDVTKLEETLCSLSQALLQAIAAQAAAAQAQERRAAAAVRMNDATNTSAAEVQTDEFAREDTLDATEETLTEQVAELLKERSVRLQHIADLTAKLGDRMQLTERHESLLQRAQAAEAALEEQRAAVDVLQSDLAAAQASLTQKTVELVEAEKARAEQRRAAESSQRQVHETQTQLTAALQERASDVGQLKAAREGEQVAKLTQVRLQERMGTLEHELTALRDSMADNNRLLAEQEKACRQAKAEAAQLAAALEAGEAVDAGQKRELAVLRKQIVDTKASLVAALKAREESEAKVQQLNAAVRVRENEQTERTARMQAQARDCAATMLRLQEVTADRDSTVAWARKVEAQRGALVGGLEMLKSQLAECRRSIDHVAAHQQEESVWQGVLEESRAARETVIGENTKLSASLQQQERERNELERRLKLLLSHLDATHSHCDVKLKTQAEALARVRAQVSEQQRHSGELETVGAECARLRAQVEELTRLQASSSAKVLELNTSLTEEQVAHKRSAAHVDAMTRQITQYEMLVASRDVRITGMQQVLDTLKAQLETGQNISLEHLMAIASHAQEEQAAPVSVHFWP